jgi:hypothetical protein
VYYAAENLETALMETVHHATRFLRESNIPQTTLRKNLLRAKITILAADVGELDEERRRAIMDPDSYDTSQEFARGLLEFFCPGITYPSVRLIGNYCVALFSPDSIADVTIDEREFRFVWNGESIELGSAD